MIHLIDKSGRIAQLTSIECKHGSLVRSCEICERDNRIKEFATEFDAALAEVIRLEDELRKLEMFKIFVVSKSIVVLAKDKEHAIALVYSGSEKENVHVKEINLDKHGIIFQGMGI